MLYPDCCPKSIPVCMDSISVDKAIDAVENLLKNIKKIED
jgi:hypothetical protein